VSSRCCFLRVVSWLARAASVFVGIVGGCDFAFADPASYVQREMEIPRDRAGLLWARFDADDRADMLVADDARLYLRLQRPDGSYADPIELDVESEFGGALFDLIDLDRDGITEIALLHQRGVDVYGFSSEENAFVRKGDPLLEKLRGIRFLHLAQQDFVEDIDGDGDDDLLYPVDGAVYFYVNDLGKLVRRGEAEMPRTTVQLASDVPRLGGLARTRIQLPRLATERESSDASRVEIRLADGRYVRAQDGATALTGEYVVERLGDDPLERFKQRHGIELKENETFQAILRDIDGDGLNDYTLVYKNRIWVYRASRDGFDFDATPDQLVKVSAADRISVLLLPLDDDRRPDMVLFKYRIPSVARLVAALAIGLRTEIEVLGYTNDQKPVFSRSPSERSTLVLKIPPLLRLIGELEDVVERFRDILRPMQGLTRGDFDGDGRDDVLRLAGDQLEIYLTRADEESPIDLAAARGREFLERYDGHELVRRVLFERRRREVTIEAAMDLAGEIVAALQSSIVGEREPESTVAIPAGLAREVDQILSQDIDGDARDDILLFVEPDREEERKTGERRETQTLHLWLSRDPKASL